MRARTVLVAVAAAAAMLGAAGPASADGLPISSQFGAAPGSALSWVTPNLSTGAGGLTGAMSPDPIAMFDSTELLGAASGAGYALVSDLSVQGELVLENADLARRAQEMLEERLRAEAARQNQVGAEGCPTSAPAGTLRGAAAGMDVYQLCAQSVAEAATPEAAKAIKYVFANLGAPYACNGVGRMSDYRFDCSSLVSRAYYEAAGVGTAGETWAPSTRDMVPWGGAALASWAAYVAPENARPGDLILYSTPDPTSEHVVMMLANGTMAHTNSCGDVAHITTFTGFGPSFSVARRVDATRA